VGELIAFGFAHRFTINVTILAGQGCGIAGRAVHRNGATHRDRAQKLLVRTTNVTQA
jgi:hypothetical protein